MVHRNIVDYVFTRTFDCCYLKCQRRIPLRTNRNITNWTQYTCITIHSVCYTPQHTFFFFLIKCDGAFLFAIIFIWPARESALEAPIPHKYLFEIYDIDYQFNRSSNRFIFWNHFWNHFNEHETGANSNK